MPRVLIVDDKPASLFLLRALLTGYECDTDEARDAGAALAAARTLAPDLVIADLHVPYDGGDTFLQQWLADDAQRHVPVIVYADSRGGQDDAWRALARGAAAYVPRPAEPAVFLARLRDALATEAGAVLPPATESVHDERRLVLEYTRLLVRTLEEKALQLEQSNRELAGREEVYRQIFDDNPQPMWMYDLQTLRFLAVNDAAVARYGYTRDEFLSMRIPDIRPHEGEARDWRHRTKDGAIIEVEITSHALGFQGRRAELVTARDMTARRRCEDRSARQRGALIALTGHHITAAGDVTAQLRQIVEVSARTLNVARVGIWRYSADRSTIKCVDLCDSTIGQHSSGAVLSAAMYPAYFAALATSQVIAVDDAVNDPNTREFGEDYLEPLGIGSMLDVPTNVDGARDGVLSHEHVGPARHWTEDEKTFAVAMGNLVSLALEAEERRRG